jgi:hypothetical protein
MNAMKCDDVLRVADNSLRVKFVVLSERGVNGECDNRREGKRWRYEGDVGQVVGTSARIGRAVNGSVTEGRKEGCGGRQGQDV